MIGEETHPLWTDVFMHGSHFVGDWKEGTKVVFLAPDKSGDLSSMLSRIKENKLYEFISIEYIGMVQEGKEDTSSEEAKEWAGSLENYSFKEKDGNTELIVELTSDMDIKEEYQEMFAETWPKALQKLKELAEK